MPHYTMHTIFIFNHKAHCISAFAELWMCTPFRLFIYKIRLYLSQYFKIPILMLIVILLYVSFSSLFTFNYTFIPEHKIKNIICKI